ncbi:efflux RND transporter periplasmic adaptor subunit [Rhodobacter sp. CZR27]|uniref:efflux RND transporter periplasmic adaptor subunit n=1 Tax=Rhodobacter sp. CZR27 TaxID=2033869 RepID=UPI000BBE6FCC|nr:efflux RND transporter periplasmic adaptor subunit [Rhodobacter sp. CZR27]
MRSRAIPNIVLAMLLAAVLAACDEEETAETEPIRPVRTVTVEKRAMGEVITLAGTVESQVQADLGFRIAGRLAERLVNVGDRIEPGQLLASLDPADEQNGLRAAEASLAAAEGQLTEARTEFGRQRQLYDRGFASRAAYDRAETALTTAESTAEAARAQYQIAARRLNDTSLLGDAPGRVTAAGAEEGEVVGAGRMIVQVARDGGKDAVFDVPAAVLAASSADPEITVAVSQFPTVSTKGRIREVAPRADASTGTFRVRVGLIKPPPEMRLGTVVTGTAVFGDTAGIEIPASALTGGGGKPAVWVLDPASGTVDLREIGVARFLPASVVVSGGLDPGEVVVTAGVQALRPGQPVRLAESRP